MVNQKKIIEIFEKWAGEKSVSFTPLPISGSIRRYFRIRSNSKTALAVYNTDKRENQAFIYLAKHFGKHQLNVPKIYSQNLNENIYLIEDLGDTTLYSQIINSPGNKFTGSIHLIENALSELPRFQITASKDIDYTKCYPRPAFDKQSIMWDLNYFKYYFLKLSGISFDEQKLEDDFKLFSNFLITADKNYFMYRDFNSRNIMVKNGDLYFIDFQGGRKGPLQYDLASFLFSSKISFNDEQRENLFEHYIESVLAYKKVDAAKFKKHYYPFVLVRILQMLGTYGYRGYFEGKPHFLTSIPFAVNNLKLIIAKKKINLKLPELTKSLLAIVQSDKFLGLVGNSVETKKLTVRINSFSYRDKLPVDYTGNGGGFVFDCRAIPNPGRLDEYKPLTGKNKSVQQFLESQGEVVKFLKESFDLVEQSVVNYIQKGWTDLMINYGCTGSQHRSVYCAEKLSEYLKHKFDINVVVCHTKLNQQDIF
jgi:aminoglycoside/choline kinase family phosphotransferase